MTVVPPLWCVADRPSGPFPERCFVSTTTPQKGEALRLPSCTEPPCLQRQGGPQAVDPVIGQPPGPATPTAPAGADGRGGGGARGLGGGAGGGGGLPGAGGLLLPGRGFPMLEGFPPEFRPLFVRFDQPIARCNILSAAVKFLGILMYFWYAFFDRERFEKSPLLGGGVCEPACPLGPVGSFVPPATDNLAEVNFRRGGDSHPSPLPSQQPL